MKAVGYLVETPSPSAMPQRPVLATKKDQDRSFGQSLQLRRGAKDRRYGELGVHMSPAVLPFKDKGDQGDLHRHCVNCGRHV